MKVAIFCDSSTGNTGKLAKCIYDECKFLDVSLYKEFKDDMLEADLIFVGSYTRDMEPSEKTKSVLKKITGKKLFLFGTCSFDSGDKYYNKILKNFASYIPASNEVVDYFYCLGKMPYTNRLIFEAKLRKNPRDKDMAKRIANFDNCLKHPNFEDLIDLQIKVKMVLNDYS